MDWDHFSDGLLNNKDESPRQQTNELTSNSISIIQANPSEEESSTSIIRLKKQNWMNNLLFHHFFFDLKVGTTSIRKGYSQKIQSISGCEMVDRSAWIELTGTFLGGCIQ